MIEVKISVAGMSCDGCVRNVTGVLKALPGVGEVVVSLDGGQACVEYDPGQVGLERLHEAIVDAGFDIND